MRVYVAGPYSADNVMDVLKNIGRGEYFASQLHLMGYAPFCAWHDKDYVIKNWDQEMSVAHFQAASMEWLEVSDCVLCLKGWEKSKGTLKEIARAEELKIPVFFSLKELDEYNDELYERQHPSKCNQQLQKQILGDCSNYND